MKLFIASPVKLENYASIKEDFKDIIECTWVKEEYLHLTWVFLGNVTDEKPLIHTLQTISPLQSTIEIANLGYFGQPPKIFFIKAEERLLYNKAKEFKQAGFELYRFKPHITLCRIKTIYHYKAYKEKCKEYREKRLGLILPEINLYESKGTSEGAKYQCLWSIRNIS